MSGDPDDKPGPVDPEDAENFPPLPVSATPDSVRKELDELVERMNAPGVRERMQEAFDASLEELGKAAVEAAKKATK